MQTVMVLLFGVFCFMLIVVAAIVPRRSMLSTFELERRREHGNQSAAEELTREVLMADILSLKRMTEASLLVFVVLTAAAAFGLVLGLFVSLGVALCYGRLATIDFVHTWAEQLYERYEPALIKSIDRQPRIAKLLRSTNLPEKAITVSSREELQHLVETSGHVVTPDERRLIESGLHFNEKTVESIMTPRSVIDTIDKNELIGPLTLDELHRTGHSRFPVMDGDIDHIIGILHIKDLLTLGNKQSQTAGDAMEHTVFYINQEQTLQHALAAFIKTRHHLFVVVNGYRETVGIITLEDVIETLLGRAIVDEYDVHDDLRRVAERSAKQNNNPPHATNV